MQPESEQTMYIGEYFEGSGVNAAHVNVIAGPKAGPVGAAFAGTLANPKPGHVPFLTVVQPGVPVKPYTVFVNKADLRGDLHEQATWGAAQAGVAVGVCDAAGLLPEGAQEDWVIIASVWVNWGADDLDAVYQNNRCATYEALARAVRDEPSPADILRAAQEPSNPFYAPPRQAVEQSR